MTIKEVINQIHLCLIIFPDDEEFEVNFKREDWESIVSALAVSARKDAALLDISKALGMSCDPVVVDAMISRARTFREQFELRKIKCTACNDTGFYDEPEGDGTTTGRHCSCAWGKKLREIINHAARNERKLEEKDREIAHLKLKIDELYDTIALEGPFGC